MPTFQLCSSENVVVVCEGPSLMDLGGSGTGRIHYQLRTSCLIAPLLHSLISSLFPLIGELADHLLALEWQPATPRPTHLIKG